MADIRVAIHGEKELQRAFAGMTRKLQNKAMRSALRQAAKPVLESARNFVPIDSGALYDSIRLKERKFGGRDIKAVEVTAGGYEAFYAHIVEFGSSKWSGDPFLWPAYQQHIDNTPKVFAAALRAKLPEIR